MKLKFIIMVAVLSVAMLPLAASATPRPLPPSPLDATLTFGDAHELGTVSPSDPEGLGDRIKYVNFMIALALGGSGTDTISGHANLVSRTLNFFGSLPTAVKTDFHNGGGVTIDLNKLGTYDYLFAKYTGASSGSEAFVWFIGNLTGVLTIPLLGPNGNHLGGWTLLNHIAGGPVPDGGASVMLLGLGISVIGAARRWLLKT